MESAFRTMESREIRAFLFCVVVSAAVHLALVWLALPGNGFGDTQEEVTRLAERFAQTANAATGLDARQKADLEALAESLPEDRWGSSDFSETLQWVATDLGLPVTDSDVVRSMDPDRSREGRWDIRVWLRWEEDREVTDFLTVAFLVGEGTLKSDFGSHRLWVHVEARDGAGKVAFETMDCRLYRAGKLTGSDLLYRAIWTE
jgi:hypothetical protein